MLIGITSHLIPCGEIASRAEHNQDHFLLFRDLLKPSDETLGAARGSSAAAGPGNKSRRGGGRPLTDVGRFSPPHQKPAAGCRP